MEKALCNLCQSITKIFNYIPTTSGKRIRELFLSYCYTFQLLENVESEHILIDKTHLWSIRWTGQSASHERHVYQYPWTLWGFEMGWTENGQAMYKLSYSTELLTQSNNKNKNRIGLTSVKQIDRRTLFNFSTFLTWQFFGNKEKVTGELY